VQCLAYLRRDAGGNKKKKKEKKPTTTHLHTTQKCLTNANFLKCKTQQKQQQQPVMRDLTYIRLRCVKKISPHPNVPKARPLPTVPPLPLVVVVPSLQRSVLVTNAYNQIIHKNKKASKRLRRFFFFFFFLTDVCDHKGF
jgi:hypothetical protein